jgi:RES domain-containing protein
MAKLPREPSLKKLRALEPAVQELPVGTRLWRLYFRGGRHPTRWSDFRHVGPLDGRFDHHLPDQQENPTLQDRSVLYAARHPWTCLAEAYQMTRVINREHKQPWLVAFELAKPVQLLDLTGRFPTQGGASMALMTGPRSVARRWAQGYYEVYSHAQGLMYPSSMHANEPAVVLNDRAEAAELLPAVPAFHRALADPALLTVLRNAARALGYLLR